MASDAQETLYRIFATLSGSPEATASGVLTGAVAEAAGISGGLPGSVAGAASAGGSSPSGSSTDGGNIAATVAMDVLKSGFGLVTLVSSLFGLFSGGEQAAPSPLVKYAMPAAREFQTAETASGLANVDYGQSGSPRAYAPSDPGSAPQINVSVQAMDARSFLDRSNEIAAAVREAMLNLNPINDVVNEL